MGKYDRTVKAALGETNSKFALAEALALDIPAKTAGDGTDVQDKLVSARAAIVKAGGEARSVATLNDYRKTAIWMSGGKTGGSRPIPWAVGSSYTAHEEARKAGLTPEAFAADPKPARATREENGKASKDGDPKKVVAGWSPAQRKAAVAEVAKTEGTEAVVLAAASEDLETTMRVTAREVSKATKRAIRSVTAIPQKQVAAGVNKGHGKLVAPSQTDAEMIASKAHRIVKDVEWLSEWVTENSPLSTEYEKAFTQYAQDIQVAAAALEISVVTPAAVGGV